MTTQDVRRQALGAALIAAEVADDLEVLRLALAREDLPAASDALGRALAHLEPLRGSGVSRDPVPEVEATEPDPWTEPVDPDLDADGPRHLWDPTENAGPGDWRP